MYSQFMMYGQKNIKLFQVSLAFECLNMSVTSHCFRDKVCCVLIKKKLRPYTAFET